MKVTVIDETEGVLGDAWEGLLAQVLVSEGAPENSEATLVFVGEEKMSELHQLHMGETGPTDVLSFPIEDGWLEDGWQAGTELSSDAPQPLGDMPHLLGDVIVCPSQCLPESNENDIALRIVHGALHLCGHDHATAEDEAAMFARQDAYLKQHFAGILSPT